MSKISFRPRGGEEGIEVTTDELVKFSDIVKSEYTDQVIPLPDVSTAVQLKRLKKCSCSKHEEIYWETEKGSHGWCCDNCGIVVQWG